MYWPWHWQGQEIWNKQEFRKNCCNSYSHVQENNRQGKGVIRQKCQKKQNSVLRRSIKIMAVRHLIIYDHKLQPAVAWNKIKKLESEIEEWRTMYKNIENYNSTAENSVAKVFSSRCPPCWILLTYTAYQIRVHNDCLWRFLKISWLLWRGVSSRPRDSSDTFRIPANSLSIALKVPFAKSRC